MTPSPSRPASLGKGGITMTSRMAWAGVVLLLEYLAVSFAFDAQALGARGGPWSLFSQMGNLGPLILVGVTAYLLSRRRPKTPPFNPDTKSSPPPPLHLLGLGAHVVALIAFLGITALAFGEKAPPGPAAAWLTAWGVFGILTGGTLLVAFLGNWRLVKTLLARILAAGGILGVVGWLAGIVTTALWQYMARATFLTVSSILQLTSLELLADSKRHILELDGFAVTIAPICSGVEGMGLFLVLMGAYLYGLRQEFMFPRALLLLPLGLSAIWFGNSLRIAALMIVGARIDPEIAVGTFHSKAGWVFFCAITLGIAALSRSLPFFLRSPSRLDPKPSADDPQLHGPSSKGSDSTAAALLVPLLLWTSVGLVTSSFTKGHDPLYGARVVLAGAALFHYRDEYARLMARPSVSSVLVGLGVGTLWIAYPVLFGEDLHHPALPGEPSTWGRAGWILTRIVGAILIIPLCEELAFRNFLARLLTHRSFSSLPLSKISVAGIAGSSLAFGLVHEKWLLATGTGVIYALVAKTSGRLTDAIVAHAASNLVIATWVLKTGATGYW